MEKKLFEELKESLNQALEHARGERNDLRTTTLPRPPRQMQSAEIAALRERLNASQAVFAHYLNVSSGLGTRHRQTFGRGFEIALDCQQKSANFD